MPLDRPPNDLSGACGTGGVRRTTYRGATFNWSTPPDTKTPGAPSLLSRGSAPAVADRPPASRDPSRDPVAIDDNPGRRVPRNVPTDCILRRGLDLRY